MENKEMRLTNSIQLNAGSFRLKDEVTKKFVIHDLNCVGTVVLDEDEIPLSSMKNLTAYTGLDVMHLMRYVHSGHLVPIPIGRTHYIVMTDYAIDFVSKLKQYVDNNGCDDMFSGRKTKRTDVKVRIEKGEI